MDPTAEDEMSKATTVGDEGHDVQWIVERP